MSLRGITAGTIIGLTLIVVFSYPRSATMNLTISTVPIPTLIPHAHEIQDKISDRHHGVEASSEPIEVPEDMWVSEISFTTLNAPQGVIHHFNVVRILPGDTEESKRRTVIATAGQDTVTEVRFPAPAGIRLAKGDQLMILGVLHNPVPPLGEGGVYQDVVVNVELKGFRNGEGRFVPLYSNYALISDSETGEADDMTFQVPVGSEPYVRSSLENADGSPGAEHQFVDDGWIVFMGAHMHAWEGGQRVDAYLNDQPIRTFSSYLLRPDVPWSYRTDTPPLFVRVRKGDMFTVSATYVNEHDTPIEGAMGMAGVYYTVDQFALGSPLYHGLWAVQGWWYGVRDMISMTLRGRL